MPNDSFSIEALMDIYEQLEDEEKLTHLKSLQGGEQKPTERAKVSNKVRVQSSRLSQRRVNLKSRPSVTDAVPQNWQRKSEAVDQIQLRKQLEDLVFSLQFALKSQVDLMITLYNVGLVSASQYSSIMYELSEHRFSRKPEKPYMVVQMLEACGGVNMEMVRYLLSKKCNMPYIDLSLMPCLPKLNALFPKSLIYNHGISIFKKIGSSYCIAVLNPLNIELMQQVVLLLKSKVHFFLTSASEFDLYVNREGP